MTVQQLHVLNLRDTNVESAMRRFCGNEGLYTQCLRIFTDDDTVAQLNDAIAAQQWDDAFTAAHAIKGVAGNMEFIPLMHATGKLIVLIRGGRISEISQALDQVNSAYRDIIDAIHQYFALADEESKGDAK